MASDDKLELEQILDVLRARGYQPLGMLFYDTKSKLLGIAPMERVPDAWVDVIGRRLGGLDSQVAWLPGAMIVKPT